MQFLFIPIIIWNVIVFGMYGADKWKSKRKQWRISEFVLIVCAFLFGAIGAFFGMCIFRHKTKNKKFTILIPLAVAVNIIFFWGIYLLASLLGIIPV